MSTLGAVLGTVKFNVEADTSNAEAGMKRVEEKGRGLGGALADIGKSATGVFAGMMAVQGITSLPGLFDSMADAARKDEIELTRVHQSLVDLAAVYGGGADAIAKWTEEVSNAEEKGRNLAYSNSEIRDSFTFLVDATGNTEEALKRQTLAMDFARGANIPLQKASMLLGKVTEANVEVFKKMGIHIGNGATEAQAFAVIQGKFAGQADAYAKSSAGQMEVAKIKFEELKKEIGYSLLPVMLGLAKVGIFLADVLGVVVPIAIDAISAAVGWLKGKAELLEEPLERIGKLAWGKLLDVFNSAKGPLQNLYESAKEFAELSWEKIQSVWETISPLIEKVASFAFNAYVEWLKLEWKTLQKVWEVIAPLIERVAKYTFKELTELGKAGWDKLQNAWKIVGPWLEKVGKLSYKELVELGKVAWDKMQKAWAVIGPGAMNFGKSMGGMDWKGMGSGLADVGEKLWKFLGPATLGAVKALFDAVKPLGAVFTSEILPALLQLGAAVEPLAKVLAGILVLSLRAVLEIIQILAPVLGVILVGAFHAAAILIEGFAGTVRGITLVLQGVVDFLIGIFTGDWDRAWSGLKEIFNGFWTILSSIVTTAWKLLVNNVETLLSAFNALFKGFFTDTLPGALADVGRFFIDGGKDILRGIKDGAVLGYTTVAQFFTDLPGNILLALAKLGALTLTLLQGGKDFITGLLDGVNWMVVMVYTFFEKLPGRLIEKMGDMVTIFLDVGKSMIEGILSGITGHWGEIASWITDKAKNLPGQILGAILGGSPALLFVPPGASMVQGLAKGVEDTWPVLQNAVIQVASNAVTTAMQTVKSSVAANWASLPGAATAMAPGFAGVNSGVGTNWASLPGAAAAMAPGFAGVGTPAITNALQAGFYDASRNLTWTGSYWQQGAIQKQDLALYGTVPHTPGPSPYASGVSSYKSKVAPVTITVQQTFNGPVNSADLRKANDEWWQNKVAQEFGYNAFISGVKGTA